MHGDSVDLIDNVDVGRLLIVSVCLAGVHNKGECEEERVAREDQNQVKASDVPSCEFIYLKVDDCNRLDDE